MPRRDYFIDNFAIHQPPNSQPPIPGNPTANANFDVTGDYSPAGSQLQAVLYSPGGGSSNCQVAIGLQSNFTVGVLNLNAGNSYMLECTLTYNGVELAFATCEFDVVANLVPPSGQDLPAAEAVPSMREAPISVGASAATTGATSKGTKPPRPRKPSKTRPTTKKKPARKPAKKKSRR
jgi:hypothetical protein